MQGGTRGIMNGFGKYIVSFVILLFGGCSEPNLKIDGAKSVIYESNYLGKNHIFNFHLEAGDSYLLTDDYPDSYSPAISPMKDRIAFFYDSAHDDDVVEIYIMGINGTNVQKIGEGVNHVSTSFKMDISPDGKFLIHSRVTANSIDLIEVDLLSGQERVVVSDTTLYTYRMYTQDGEKILSVGLKNELREVSLIDRWTAEKIILTQNGNIKVKPSESEDQMKVVFGVIENEYQGLIVYDLSTSTFARLPDSDLCFRPVFSPAGDEIYYHDSEYYPGDIGIIHIETGAKRQVNEPDDLVWSISISENSDKILKHSSVGELNGPQKISLVQSDFSNEIVLMSGSWRYRDVEW